MRRPPPALIRRAQSESHLLDLLLRVCRDLPSARNELRWLQEHARNAIIAKRDVTQSPAVAHGCDRLENFGESDRREARKVKLNAGEIENSLTSKKSRERGMNISGYSYGRLHRTVSPIVPVADATPARDTVPTARIRRSPALALDLPPQPKAGNPRVLRKVEAPRYSVDKRNAGGSNIKFVRRIGRKIRSLKSKPGLVSKPLIRQVETPAAGNGNATVEDSRTRLYNPKRFRIRAWADGGVHAMTLDSQTGGVLLQPGSNGEAEVQKIVADCVEQRSRGVPLQYIIGNQPFGKLDILCHRKVLIPRPETEIYTERVAMLLLTSINAKDHAVEPRWERRKKFRILDLCTGTGCIALLLCSILKPVNKGFLALPSDLEIEILGVDNSCDAIELARKNLKYNISQNHLRPDAIHSVSFRNLDILKLAKNIRRTRGKLKLRRLLNAAPSEARVEQNSKSTAPWDMVVANPPYVDPKDYEPGGETEPSVRDYEPKEALVPVAPSRFQSASVLQSDLFYWPLYRIADAVGAQLLLMEVGDQDQAARVCEMIAHNRGHDKVKRQYRARVESWKDDGSVKIHSTRRTSSTDTAWEDGTDANISDRAVVVWSKQMAHWRSRTLGQQSRARCP